MADGYLATRIQERFLDRLAASPRGRAYILAFLAGAEEADEVGVFDHLLARVDDPELQRMVRRHRDDELEHGARFHACVARQGLAAPPPEAPNVIGYIDRELGGFGDAFVADDRSVMEAYVLLQVIEERGVLQYPIIARAMAKYDPHCANEIMEIVADEHRHIKYAIAISRRYADSDAVLADTLVRLRAAEARAFEAHGRAFFVHAIEHGMLATSWVEGMMWRALAALERRRLAPPVARQPFATNVVTAPPVPLAVSHKATSGSSPAPQRS